MNIKIGMLVPAIVAAAFIIYFVLFYSNGYLQQPSINSSFLSIGVSACQQCSYNVPSFVYGLLSGQGYTNSRVSLDFGSQQANKVISNSLITSLPSVVVPATSSAANILDALVYLNVFNLGGNDFVLNTPFLSGLTKNVTFYSVIQNRTITSYDIYNVSAVYGVHSSSPFLNLLNPSEFLLQVNASNMSSANKTVVQFIYDNSPFSAVQSLVLKSALDNFGNFTSVYTIKSKTINVSSSQYLGPDTLYNFGKMQFQSDYFDFQAYNISLLNSQTAQRNLFQYDQNAATSINSVYGSFTPFLDIGGKFIEVSSMLRPSVFNGMNLTQVHSLIVSNSTVNKMFSDSVAFVDAALCSFSNVKANVCDANAVKQQELNILQQI